MAADAPVEALLGDDTCNRGADLDLHLGRDLERQALKRLDDLAELALPLLGLLEVAVQRIGNALPLTLELRAVRAADEPSLVAWTLPRRTFPAAS